MDCATTDSGGVGLEEQFVMRGTPEYCGAPSASPVVWTVYVVVDSCEEVRTTQVPSHTGHRVSLRTALRQWRLFWILVVMVLSGISPSQGRSQAIGS